MGDEEHPLEIVVEEKERRIAELRAELAETKHQLEFFSGDDHPCVPKEKYDALQEALHASNERNSLKVHMEIKDLCNKAERYDALEKVAREMRDDYEKIDQAFYNEFYDGKSPTPDTIVAFDAVMGPPPKERPRA